MNEDQKQDLIDIWIHRSKNMLCHKCMYFVPKSRGEMLPPENGKWVIGRCRRHAPTMSGFPVVFERDWCGDHKLDENKV